MPYTIDKYNGTTLAVVEDGTIDSTLDIKLIGKNYAGYGEVQNENFVHILENFAGANPPSRAISGQIWYDSSNKKVKFYDSTLQKWKNTGSTEVSANAPAGLSTGDFWYDSTNKQIYVYDGSTYVLVGPQGVAGLGTTQMKSMTVTDTSTAEHAIIAAYVDGEVMYVVSSDLDFELSTASTTLLGGASKFRYIKPGITLVNTANTIGITDVSSGRIFWGTASNSLKLQGYSAADFVLNTPGGIIFSSIARFADVGFTVGDSNDLAVKIDTDGITPIIKNDLSSTIKFQTTSAGPTVNTPLRLVNANILPGTDSDGTSGTDIGASAFKFKNVHAVRVYGDGSNLTNLDADELTSGTVPTARLSGTYTINISGSSTSSTTATTAINCSNLLVGGNPRSGSVSTPDSGDPDTVAVRTSAGDLCATIFRGTATSALFADLAEKYLADKEYDVGTVVVVGGEAEVTECMVGDRAFGAVSANPAFKMNDGLEGGTYIALKGRVPVKVIGAVRKGDKLIAAGNGCAGPSHIVLRNTSIRAGSFPDTFAIALESSDDEGVKLIESVIL